MKDELRLKMHFTTPEEPEACKKCQWGRVEPFYGEKRYGVHCFIPDLEAMKGECPQKIAPSKIELRFYEKPADRIHAVYIAQKHTMRKIADAGRMDDARGSDIVNGYQRPTATELERICRFLKMSAREYELLSLEYDAIDRAIIEQAEKLKEES